MKKRRKEAFRYFVLDASFKNVIMDPYFISRNAYYGIYYQDFASIKRRTVVYSPFFKKAFRKIFLNTAYICQKAKAVKTVNSSYCSAHT